MKAVAGWQTKSKVNDAATLRVYKFRENRKLWLQCKTSSVAACKRESAQLNRRELALLHSMPWQPRQIRQNNCGTAMRRGYGAWSHSCWLKFTHTLTNSSIFAAQVIDAKFRCGWNYFKVFEYYLNGEWWVVCGEYMVDKSGWGWLFKCMDRWLALRITEIAAAIWISVEVQSATLEFDDI